MLINHKQICLFSCLSRISLPLVMAGGNMANPHAEVGKLPYAGRSTHVCGLYNLRARVGEQTVKRCRTDHRRRGFL